MSLQSGAETAPVTPESEPATTGAVPAWVPLVVLGALALVLLVIIGILALVGKPIPDALLSPTSAIVGALLLLVRPRS